MDGWDGGFMQCSFDWGLVEMAWVFPVIEFPWQQSGLYAINWLLCRNILGRGTRGIGFVDNLRYLPAYA